LNLGSYTTMFHGWRNLDRLDLAEWAHRRGYAFTQWDLSNGLPYDAGIADLIFMSHALEHFSYDDGARLLGECRRVLKQGGLIRVAVPDARRLIGLFLANELRGLEQLCAVEDSTGDIQILHELLYGGDHRATYDADFLVTLLKRAGFSTARQVTF